MPGDVSGGHTLAYSAPQEWAQPTVGVNFYRFGDVEVQIIGLTVAFTPQRSMDGTTYVNANAIDKDGTVLTSITADGFYSIDGGCYVRLSGGAATSVYARGSM